VDHANCSQYCTLLDTFRRDAEDVPRDAVVDVVGMDCGDEVVHGVVHGAVVGGGIHSKDVVDKGGRLLQEALLARQEDDHLRAPCAFVPFSARTFPFGALPEFWGRSRGEPDWSCHGPSHRQCPARRSFCHPSTEIGPAGPSGEFP
jgi:hypothetical protein